MTRPWMSGSRASRTTCSIWGRICACPIAVFRAGRAEKPALRITQAQVDRLEAEIDELNAELSPLRSFVLPGGKPAAAQLHVARTVSRRAEREMIRLAAEPAEAVGDGALKYINRLSDFLFVASRFVNDRGAADVLWVPGKNG